MFQNSNFKYPVKDLCPGIIQLRILSGLKSIPIQFGKILRFPIR